ncbi:MAG: pilus assembly protein TadG-related protein, partial [Actinobacteria bacterium]|nr:pilus assembly protein TadG-related protein [Actinomycetota bacterium]
MRFRDESGAILIIVALLMVVFLVLVAMSVDLGDLYIHDRDLQTAADAAALAGAQELIYSGGAPSPASVKAIEYVSRNAAVSHVEEANLDAWAPAVDSRSVTVDLREHGIPFMFAPVIGQSEGAVTAHARAEVKYLTGADKLFPVAVNYLNPYRFRFLIQRGGATIDSFDLSDPDKDGVFDNLESGGSFTPPAAGWYDITLQAIDEDGSVGMQLDNVGGWWAADPAGALLAVGMSRAVGGSTISVRIQVGAAVTDPVIAARLGNDGFSLLPVGGGVYQGTVAAPTDTTNAGWQTHDLTIDKKIASGPIARYVAFHPDVPLQYLMFFDSFYGGYSGTVGSSSAISTRPF